MQNDETLFCPCLKMTERFLPVPQGCNVCLTTDNFHLLVCYTLFLFFFPATSNMASPSETLSLEPESEEVVESGPLKRKRGASRGGAGAKYCSMSPWQRKKQFLTVAHFEPTKSA